jgi:hypothetical protein
MVKHNGRSYDEVQKRPLIAVIGQMTARTPAIFGAGDRPSPLWPLFGSSLRSDGTCPYEDAASSKAGHSSLSTWDGS